MDAVQRSTLVVGVEPKVFDRISKMLKINDFLSDFSETGGVALESISFLPFDAIVAACPLPDMPVSQFLDAVRGIEDFWLSVVRLPPQYSDSH